MDLNREFRGEEPMGAEINPDVAATLARPTRPVRPNIKKRTERPLVLDQLARAERPEPQRRARVLEPDQIAASRGEAIEVPQSMARDLAYDGDTDTKSSKAGGALRGFAKLVSGLRKSKRADAPDAGEELEEMEALEAVDEHAFDGDAELSDDFAESDAFDGEVDSAGDVAEKPVARRSLIARLDTPIVGVAAALCVSLVGVIAASAVLG